MKRFWLFVLCAGSLQTALGWGQKGHDVTAYIAECNLTPEVAQEIDRVLDGHSPVYYANWLDSASHTPEYAYTRTWHYANIDEGYTYDTMPKEPAGDVVTAVNDLVAELKSKELSAEKEAEALKMLIHLVGDMHCPMHSGHRSDRGRNTIPLPSRQAGESALDLGYVAARSRSQMELHRVAESDRPVVGR